MSWQERTGVFHVHSCYSDGAGSVEDILCAGRAAELDFIVLTDHDTFAARREGWEGMHDGQNLLVAAEITPVHDGHVLAMNARHCHGYAAQHNNATLDAIAAQGGYAVIAHPMGARKPSLRIHHAAWYDWNHPAVRGMEIWSYMHDWVDEVAWWRLPVAYEFWRHPSRRVKGPERMVLRQWDRLGRTRRLAGLGGLDCHARRIPLTARQVFPYEQMFRFLRNHFLVAPEAWSQDPGAALWDALAQGRGFVAHDILADSAGTQAVARLPDGRVLQMGEEAEFCRGTAMSFSLPREAEVRWVVNGRIRITAHTARLDVTAGGPGVYRFEAWLNQAPWVFANPFYLR